MKQGNNDNGEHFWKAKDVIAVQPCIPEMFNSYSVKQCMQRPVQRDLLKFVRQVFFL